MRAELFERAILGDGLREFVGTLYEGYSRDGDIRKEVFWRLLVVSDVVLES